MRRAFLAFATCVLASSAVAADWNTFTYVGTEKAGEAEIRFPRSKAPAWLTTRVVLAASDPAALAKAKRLGGFTALAPSGFKDDVHLVTFASPRAAHAAAVALDGQPGVRYAHPDFRFTIETRGNDPTGEPFFARQWHLDKIAARAAWRHSTGSSEVIVAVLDGGFEDDHPDLRDAWLVNTAEIPGNRRDDDGNGLVDDVKGWNFATDGANLIYGFSPSHGTAVAGVVGARANGVGVTGVCPECRLLPLVVDGTASTAAAAFHYAKLRGAAVATNSWGYAVGTPSTKVVEEAIAEAARDGRGGKGMTIVFATNNAHIDICRGPEPDISSLDAVLAVSSTDNDDVRVPAAGYGRCLDVLAPSSRTYDHAIGTVDRQGAKGYNTGDDADDFDDDAYTNTFSGTSAATPQVAGTFALIYSLAPDITAAEAKEIVLGTTDKVGGSGAGYDPSTGHSTEYGFGRVNSGAALDETARRRR